MSSSPARRRILDTRIARRFVTIGLLAITTVVAVALSPILIVGAFVTDVLRRDPGRRLTRLALFAIGSLIIESVGLVLALLWWMASPLYLTRPRRARWARYRGFMGWYTNTLLALFAKTAGTHIEWRDHADLSRGPVVMIARHTSFFDALIPATVLAHRNRLLGFHVLAAGLRFMPCIDVVGHRFPMVFLDRTPTEGSAALPEITAIGLLTDADSAGVIFPEGTFRNPARFERAVARLRERDPEVAERASRLRHGLPPRPAGTYALLAGMPGADVVVCANTGFEPFGTIKEIMASFVAERPIVVETWRIDRSEVPDDADEFGRWLLAQYERIDDWVETIRTETREPSGSGC